MEMNLLYRTRDENGTDIEKTVEIKQFPVEQSKFTCKICGKKHREGCRVKRIVSANFCDWQYVGDVVCINCSRLFSLFKYNYIVNGDNIRLLNVREMAKEIRQPQEVPFRVVVTKNQKKHLFYKATVNYSSQQFYAALENEIIAVNLPELNEIFDFIGWMQAAGESKAGLGDGKISAETICRLGPRSIFYLQEKLKGRIIQLALHLSQKPETTKEEALCNLDLLLTTTNTQKRL